MAHFIGVAHRAQVLEAREAGFVAFSHGKESAVRGLSPGDTVIYYAPKTDFDGDPVQAFVALADVTGETPEERAFMGGDFIAWTRAATFRDVSEVPVKPMLEELSFVKNPKHWGMAFRNGKFEISAEDHGKIAEAMLGGTP